jgi:hypothetical protein
VWKGREKANAAEALPLPLPGWGDAVFDLNGRWLSSSREVRQQADRVATDLMAGGGSRDWTVWIVDVRDAAGRSVLMRAFTLVKVASE